MMFLKFQYILFLTCKELSISILLFYRVLRFSTKLCLLAFPITLLNIVSNLLTLLNRKVFHLTCRRVDYRAKHHKMDLWISRISLGINTKPLKQSAQKLINFALFSSISNIVRSYMFFTCWFLEIKKLYFTIS